MQKSKTVSTIRLLIKETRRASDNIEPLDSVDRSSRYPRRKVCWKKNEEKIFASPRFLTIESRVLQYLRIGPDEVTDHHAATYPFRVGRLSIRAQAPWPTSDASPSASAKALSPFRSRTGRIRRAHRARQIIEHLPVRTHEFSSSVCCTRNAIFP